MSDERREKEPFDRLTRLCAVMTDALEVADERGDEKVIVFMTSESERRSGIQLHGYDNDTEAMADLLMHLKAIFRANGKRLSLVPIKKMGNG